MLHCFRGRNKLIREIIRKKVLHSLKINEYQNCPITNETKNSEIKYNVMNIIKCKLRTDARKISSPWLSKEALFSSKGRSIIQ